MDSVFEKITLYDILGYLLPGSVLMLLLLFGTGPEAILGYLEKWSLENGFLYFVFFLASYLVGIALSELMTRVWKYASRVRSRLFKGRNGNRKRIEENYSPEQIAVGLHKMGIEDGATDPTTIVTDFRQRYMRQIYGVIQGKEDYKRIHNYASAYVLYKNVTGALGIGTIYILINTGRSYLMFCMTCLFLAMVFAVRAERFQNKKEDYAIVWFMEEVTKNI